MDILDIDEILKDDSFIFLEDKTHDDISNILQQWKSNSCLSSTFTAAQQQQSSQQQEQIIKLDNRKFVRPKRKSTQNLEAQFANTTCCESSINTNVQCSMSNEKHPMLNLQIGGLVTTMEKSCLQDTSPPSFLCSMDNSINSLSNSLVTSADFTNISFLQSPNSLYLGGVSGRGRGERAEDQQEQRYHQLNITNGTATGRSSVNNYTLTEMLRDRKILESLFISNDGTFIKDSHIGQIDDISLALSKTASSCSTIENSTGSDDDYADVNDKEQNCDANRTVIMCNNDHTFNKDSSGNDQNNIIDDDNIACNLIKNRTRMEHSLNQNHSITTNTDDRNDVNNGNQQEPANINVLAKVNNDMDNIINNNNDNNTNDIEINKTFDYSHINNVTPNDALSPVDNIDTNQLRRFCESTPLASSVRCPKQNYASKLNAIVDTTISPITQTMSTSSSLPRQLNVTYEQLDPQTQNQHQHNATYIFNSSNNGIFDDDNANKADKHKEFNKRIERTVAAESSNSEKQKLSETYNTDIPTTTIQDNAMNLNLHLNEMGIETNLLTASKNEEEFDHMLDKFGKIQLNSEQLIKMKKSLDSLKKRFNYNATVSLPNTSSPGNASVIDEVGEGNISARNSNDDITRDSSERQSQSKPFNDQENFHNNIMPIQNDCKNLKSTDSNKNTPIQLSNGFNVPLSNTMTNININISGNSCGERLLTRRSRLYDDINMSTISSTNGVTLTSTDTTTMTATATTTQISKRSSDSGGDRNTTCSNSAPASSSFTRSNQEQQEKKQKIEVPIADRLLDKNTNLNKSSSLSPLSSPPTRNNDKLMEKLQNDRDRDRFKTIVISKNRNQIIGGNDHMANDEYKLISSEFNNVPCDLDSTANVGVPTVDNAGEIFAEAKQKPDVQSKIEPNPDRFKTIKIKNKKRFPEKSLFKVPCIDDNVDDKQCNSDSEKPLAGECILLEKYSRCDQVETRASAIASTTLNNNINSSHSNKNFFTYKKQKLNADVTGTSTSLSRTEEEDLKNPKTNMTTTNIAKYNVRPEERTLSRPRFISGLKKLSAENKATSADELQKATLQNANRNCSNHHINQTINTQPSKNAHFRAGTITLTNSNNLKSPMGVKSKSFHNLSSNIAMSQNVTVNGSSSSTCTIAAGIGKIWPEKELSKMHGLRKPNGNAIGGNSVNTLMKSRNSLQPITAGNKGIQQQKSDDTIFKIPKQVSGIRAPAAISEGGKRVGLVRPSSGFYSLNMIHKGIQQQQCITNCTDGNIGRHSSTDSMSSVSSKGSTHSLSNTQFGIKQSLGTITVTASNPSATNTTLIKPVKMQTNLNLQQVTIASSGIPKPSGLRPPTSIKQRSSGLPRPGSYIRSDK